MEFYTGIGSRETPIHIQQSMVEIASHLYEKGLRLRSGHAKGADQAFEDATPHLGECEIYLPWEGFQGSSSNWDGFYTPNSFPHNVQERAYMIARQYHPAWHRCSPKAQDMHCRNVHQVLGKTLDRPSKFVVCWTPGGKAGGGTGQAIRIARGVDVPVFDLGDERNQQLFMEYLDEHNLL